MKLQINELGHCFHIELQAETVADAAILVRLKMNASRKPANIFTSVDKSGVIQSAVQILRIKEQVSYIT